MIDDNLNRGNYNSVELRLISIIRQFPSLYRSKMDVLNHLFLRYHSESPWVDGHYVDYDSIEPHDISWSEGVRHFLYGHQNHVTVIGCDWTDKSALHMCDPADINTDWLKEIQDFIWYLTKFTIEDYKIHIQSRMLTYYSRASVGYTDWYPRYMKCFEQSIQGLDDLADKFGWEFATRRVYHDPEVKARRTQHMNEFIDKVLNEADD